MVQNEQIQNKENDDAVRQPERLQRPVNAATDKSESTDNTAQPQGMDERLNSEDITILNQIDSTLKEAQESLRLGEIARTEAESIKAQSEIARDEAESARAMSEIERDEAESAREKAEQVRRLAEKMRSQAEKTRNSVEAERAKAEAAKKLVDKAMDTAILALQEATTAKEVALKAQEEAEFRYYLVIEATNDAIWDWEIEENKICWNNRLAKMLGYEQEDTLPSEQELWSAIHPEDKSGIQATLQTALFTNQHFEHTFRIQNKVGQYLYCLMIGQAILDKQGMPIRIVGMISDVTRQKEAEKALKDYQIKLEQSNRALENFAGIAAYELHKPLRKIRVFSEHFAQDVRSALSSQSIDDLQRMRCSIIRMQKLIKDLFAFSKVSQTETMLSLEPLSLSSLIARTQMELNDQIVESQAFIELGQSCMIKGDVVQLGLLFLHLLENAIKFQPIGNKPYIKVYCKVIDEQFCEITIEDNGIGFEQSRAEQIFGIFERLHRGTTFPGTGLGLAICRRIVERHNGSIKAFSTPGKGAEFIIRLPA